MSIKGGFYEEKIIKRIAVGAVAFAMAAAQLPMNLLDLGPIDLFSVYVSAENTAVTCISRTWDDTTKSIKENSLSITDYTLMQNSSSSYYDIGGSENKDYWYVVSGNVTMGSKTTIRVTGDCHLILCDGAKLTAADGIYIRSDATLSIYGQSDDASTMGRINAKPKGGPGIGGMNNTVAGDLVIHGGYIDAEGGSNAAGIGGGNHDSGIRSVTIYGGEVHAQGGSSGAGIGEGQQNNVDENIYIYGGKVYATGGKYGAGIGSGEDRGCGYVYIHGGEVHAQGGHDGAGIGGGEMGNDPKELEISGGEVHATAGDNGAAIGGGEHGDGGNITISGGTVTATGSTVGAAIGGGKDGSAGTISISGGTVNAYHIDQAEGAAIGCGKGGSDGTIDISGGVINACHLSGGTPDPLYETYGAAIGGSKDSDFKGTITISGGSVSAKSCNGAAIGAGCYGNLKGDITITGSPIVTASSSTGGAGIGAGQESVLGSGGEVDATISIDLTKGGKVDAYSSGGAAIGHGKNGSDNGTLALSDRMRVNDADKNDRVSSCRTGRAVITLCTHENKAVTFDETNHTITCTYCKAYSETDTHTFIQHGTTDSYCEVCRYRNDLPFCSITVMQQMTDENGGIIEGSYQGAAVKTPRDSSFILPECNIEVTGYTFAGYQAVRKSSVQAEDNDSNSDNTDNNTPTFETLSDTIYQPGDVYTLSDQNVTINGDSWTLTFLPLYAQTVTVEYIEGAGISYSSYPDSAAKGYPYTLVTHSSNPAGKEFRAWSINGTEYAEGAVIIPKEDITATAVYDDVYTITSTEYTNGTITASAESACAKEEITVDVKADNGYKIKSVKMNGTPLQSDSEEDNDKAYTFTMPAANVTITAEFEPISYNITYKLNDNTIATTNPATYNVESADITLANPAVPGDAAQGTMFCGWYDNETFKGERITEIPTGSFGDLTLYARFDRIRITEAMLSLNGDIGVTVRVAIPEDYTGDGYVMHISAPKQKPKECSVAQAYDSENGIYVFSYNVAAKETTDSIDLTLKNELDETVYTESISVRKIALSYLADSEIDEKAKALVKAMLNYGSYALEYFEYKTGALANADLVFDESNIRNITADDISKPYNGTNDIIPKGVKFEGATLSLKSETTLSLYFTGLTADTKFTCNGKTVETAKNGSYVVARIRGIKAEELINDFTVTFKKGNENGSVTYSPMTYCYNAFKSETTDVKLKNVCRALYLYGEGAVLYKKSLNEDNTA